MQSFAVNNVYLFCRAEYSQHQDPTQLQRGLKLILKVGSNATPEYSANSPLTALDGHGPPTAAEAMMSAAPGSPNVPEELQCGEVGHRERHKKSKKKKKKKDREKKHKHHKEKRHRSRDRHRELCSEERHLNDDEATSAPDEAACSGFSSQSHQRSPRSQAPASADAECSQDGFSFMDDDAEQSQPLPENILYYASITTDNSPSNCPVTKPIAPRKLDEMLLSSPTSSSMGMTAGGSPTKPLPDVCNRIAS